MSRRGALLRLLSLMPATRYGTMGQAHRRPDQQSDPPPSAVAPTQSAGTLRARTVIIFGTGVNIGLFVYTGTPALGNPPQIAIVPNTTTKDPFGNLIGTSKILMQANTITESGGIFRTAAVSPLIQLDGPHNALLVYDAAAVLRVTIAPVATTDGLGNTVPGGLTAFFNQTFYANLSAAQLTFTDTVNAVNSGGIVQLTSVTLADDAIQMQSPTNLASDIASTLTLQRAATPGPAHAIIGNADLNIKTNTPPGQPSAGISVYSDANSLFRYRPSLSGDTNAYGSGWKTLYLASDQLVNSLSMANVITIPSVGAVRYRIHAVIWFTTTSAAGQAALQIASTGAASAVAIDYENGPFSGGGTTNRGILSALAVANNSQTLANGVEQVIKLDGSVLMSASGNLGIQMACTIAATNTYTVKAQSFLEISPS